MIVTLVTTATGADPRTLGGACRDAERSGGTQTSASSAFGSTGHRRPAGRARSSTGPRKSPAGVTSQTSSTTCALL